MLWACPRALLCAVSEGVPVAPDQVEHGIVGSPRRPRMVPVDNEALRRYDEAPVSSVGDERMGHLVLN